jgi:hypothetical protein
MATKNQTKNGAAEKIRFFPVDVLKNGILLIDGHMTYTDGRNRWLFVSEDGQNVVMYNDVADMIRELFRRGGDDDFVVTGRDLDPHRFSNLHEEMYRYYNERFN